MKRREGKDEVIIIEKRYGCYRCGVALSLVLILILIIVIAIPSALPSLFDNQELNTSAQVVAGREILLLVLIFVFVLLGASIVFFINYQHRQAYRQRLQSEHGIYTLQRARIRRGDSKVNDVELQKLKLDLNSNEKNVPIKK